MYNPMPTEVVLTNVRLSYVHIMKPYANDPSQEPKYSCTTGIHVPLKRNMGT